MNAKKLDVETCRERLVAERHALADTETVRRGATEVVDLDQARVGRVSRADALQDQAMARATQARAEERVKRIDAALRRIDEGSFGECARCGEPIAPGRLEADPTATLCLACAERA
ncbi:MAG TPA: TraR/DksA family transcriptional regulator [Steroidobacteraceae bacterium]|nr:TraR/DksA family transcriptional regulator [Steroidobacteraceae bacterium]